MKRLVAVIGMAAVLSATASVSSAWGPGMGQGIGPGYGPGMAALNLSADQVAKIQQIQTERFADMNKVRDEMLAKRSELQALFREPVLDHAKIAAKQQELTVLQTHMRERGLAARTAMAEILTPEQRAQLPAYGPGMGPGHGRGMGMGFGPRW